MSFTNDITSVIVDDLNDVDYVGMPYPMIVIYDHPKDYPDHFVARVWCLGQPTQYISLSKSADSLRKEIPEGFTITKKPEGEDPVILETYIR